MSGETPFERNIVYCPGCDQDLKEGEFEFLGLIEELGNVIRYRCRVCSHEFDTLSPMITPDKPIDRSDIESD